MIWQIDSLDTLDKLWQKVDKLYHHIEVAEPVEAQLHFNDDFDHHILRSGHVLLNQAGKYVLSNGDAVWTEIPAKSIDFVFDLDDSEFKYQLSELVSVRKLETVLTVSLTQTSYVIRDDELKAMLRVSVQQSDNTAVLKLTSIRGYEKVAQRFRRLLAELDSNLINTFDSRYWLDKSGFQISDYTAKPKFSFEPTKPAREAVREMAATMLSIAQLNESGIIEKGDDTEYLHDYRVCLRKVRSLISLLKEVYPESQQAELKQRLGDVARRTNELRDLDVYLLEQENYSQMIPVQLRDGLPQMFEDFAKRHKTAKRNVNRWLASKAYQAEMTALIEFFASADMLVTTPESEMPIYQLVTKKLKKRYRKICKLGLAITPETPDEEVHELRIECKKFRYLLEFFGALYDKKQIKLLVKRLKQLQDNLGKFNDYSVQQESLAAYLAEHANNSELSKSIGALLVVLDQGQQSERNQVETKFAEFADDVTAQLVTALFA